MTLLSLYVDRTRFEIRAMLRDSRTVMFSMLMPIFLLVIFGSVFHGQTIQGTNVTYTQYLLSGMIASGMLYAAFQQLAIAVPEERANGTLKRLYGSPAPRSVYFVGKLGVCLFTYVFQLVFLLVLGHFLYHVRMPVDAAHWWNFAWLSVLGLTSSALLGVAFSNFARNGQAAAARAAPIVLFFQFTSGVYFIFTNLPTWMQDVAAFFPLKWLAQGMRGVFLPAAFGHAEVGHSFEFGKAALILGIWTVIGLFICLRRFRWLPAESL